MPLNLESCQFPGGAIKIERSFFEQLKEFKQKWRTKKATGKIF